MQVVHAGVSLGGHLDGSIGGSTHLQAAQNRREQGLGPGVMILAKLDTTENDRMANQQAECAVDSDHL